MFSFDIWLGYGSETPRRTLPGSVKGLRALIVDDNPVAREILADQLAGLGLRADAVGSGEDGLVAVGKADDADPYSLVFMDWHMPDMDGLETIHRLRHLPLASSQPKVVMVTAFGVDNVREHAESVLAFLTKPVTESHVWDSVVACLAPEQREAYAEEGRQAAQDFDFHDQNIHVLLVEDNEVNQQIAAELLESAGVSVTIAGNGAQALEKLRTTPDPPPWTLVLMDLQMPVMDGYRATAELRREARFANLPIIAMTAHALAEERARCLAGGMNDHISKPIEPDVLYRTILRWSGADARQTPATSVLSDNVDALPDAIPGIDLGIGLHLAAGRRSTYLKVLHMFLHNQEQTAERLRAALVHGDHAGALRLIHTAKGLAGNIGALALADAAARAERQLRADPADGATAAALLDEFSARLDALLITLRGTLTPHAQSPGPAPASAATGDAALHKGLRPQLLSLRDQLRAGDMDAARQERELAPALRLAFASERVDGFGRAISQCDFDAAETLLASFLTEMSAAD